MWGAILDSMVTGRLVPLVLAIAIAFAPVALEACQATCELHEAADSAAGHSAHHHHDSAAAVPAHAEHHGCHDVAPPIVPGGGAIKGLPHSCDHGEDLPESGRIVAPIAVAAPAVLPSSFEFPRPVEGPRRTSETLAQLSSSRIVLTGQLRV
jgi:hypothetical protein